MATNLPIGISDFKEVVSSYDYVDKSLFIQEILDVSAKIILLPRPRRFGKTINMTMLRYFFEKSEESNRELFSDLEISKIPECMEKQGRYPVIYLTFKDIKQPSFESCFEAIREVLAEVFLKHAAQVEPVLEENELKKFKRISNEEANQTELQSALKLLTEARHKASGERVILLIDEYDTPIQSAYTNGYYEDAASLVRNLLGAALKDNIHVEKGVMTGILRVARESLFSGLNNLDVFTILENQFADKFGFTEREVETLFQKFDVDEEKLADARKWYNGYLFGGITIYNPWSIINYLDKPGRGFEHYWIGTSSNDLIRDLIVNGSPEIHENMELLLNGGTIEANIESHIALRDLGANPEMVWSLMTHAGYLKPVSSRQPGRHRIYELAVPNEEVLSFFETCIKSWMKQTMGDSRLKQMLGALTSGDVKTFGKYLKVLVSDVLSVHYVAGARPERVYHAFVLGLLVNLSGQYRLRSNRESGFGRYDVMMTPGDVKKPGVVFEFKQFDEEDESNEQDALTSALNQIKEKNYAAELRAAGVTQVLAVAVVFKGKQVFVENEQL